jgi:hypothetical protein
MSVCTVCVKGFVAVLRDCIRCVLFTAFGGASGAVMSYSSCWLVGHDDIYGRIDHWPFRFITIQAELIHSFGSECVITLSAVLGLIIGVTFHPRLLRDDAVPDSATNS